MSFDFSDRSAGIVVPPQQYHFIADVSEPVSPDIGFQWSVSRGRIARGQGTRSIWVDLPNGYDLNVTATVEVSGLTAGCPHKAWETAETIIDPGPILVDEYSVPAKRIDTVRLDTLADLMKKDDAVYGYIIEYFPPNTPGRVVDRKIALTTNYLKKVKGFGENDFKIVTANGNEHRTKLYTVPPGAGHPVP